MHLSAQIILVSALVASPGSYQDPCPPTVVPSHCAQSKGGVPPDSAYAVYDATLPVLVRIAEGAWGTPTAWGRPAGERTTLTLDPRLLLVATSDSQYHGQASSERLDSTWAASSVGHNGIASTCSPPDSTSLCQRGKTTLVVALSEIHWPSKDHAKVFVYVSRPTFASMWRVELHHTAEGWVVEPPMMIWIS
jgi:hypothetical protein